ncbi:MAG: hypothetical protein C0425_09075 [Chlorobiaceae bacterium]|nr:hypothetical protein [Chlorobiaceae bacterium]MBA4310475.1 hypothetical protein [Chlorobiaceae bacterium]
MFKNYNIINLIAIFFLSIVYFIITQNVAKQISVETTLVGLLLILIVATILFFIETKIKEEEKIIDKGRYYIFAFAFFLLLSIPNFFNYNFNSAAVTISFLLLVTIYLSSTQKTLLVRAVLLITFSGYYFLGNYALVMVIHAVFILLVFRIANIYQFGKINLKILGMILLLSLLAAIRVELILPLILFVVFCFRQDLIDLTKIFLTSSISMLVMSIILQNHNSTQIFHNGLYLVFSSDISIWILFSALLILFFVGWIISDLRELMFVAGLIYLAFGIYDYLANQSSGILIFTTLFFILTLKEYRVTPTLGKIIDINEK